MDTTMTAQEHYEECIRNGCSPRLAEMLVLQQPPMSNSDREFLEGTENGRQFAATPEVGDLFAAEAKAAGVDVKGKVYKNGLARFPGDPEAWVSDRGELRRRLEGRPGWRCRGSVNHSSEPCEPKQVEIADDLVMEEVAEIVSTLPAADQPHVDIADLASKVREHRKPSKKTVGGALAASLVSPASASAILGA